MELTQLAQFKAIAGCESISRAAEKAYVSQPSLSAALQELEDELGARLFERRKGRIFLNEAGKLAFSRAAIILEQAEKLKQDINQYQRKENTISIAFCDPGPLRYCIPQCSLEFPGIEIHYSRFEEKGNETELLRNVGGDIVFTSKAITYDDVMCVQFITDRLFLSAPASHPLAKEKIVSLRNMQSLEIHQIDPGGSFTAKNKAFFKQLQPNIQLMLYDDPAFFNQMLHRSDNRAVLKLQFQNSFRLKTRFHRTLVRRL
jgi:DNA-binding transcriptional LysR family regulator